MLDNVYAYDRRPSMARVTTMVVQWMQFEHQGLEWVGSCKGDSGTWSFYVLHSIASGQPNDIAFSIATNVHGDVVYFSW